MDEIQLARELLKINSVSGNELEIGNYIVNLLRPYFKIKKQKVGNSFNIFAYIGKPKLILNTHIDTVAPFFEVKENERYLYGRGACDTKGLMASMLCAGIDAAKEGVKDFGILFTVREETDFAGVKKAINLVNPEIMIVGEPTNFDFVVGQKGIISAKIIARGKTAHSATPEKGDSAISKLLDVLQKIQKMILPTSPQLGPTTLNIGKISGGVASNIVPDYAEASISFRLACDSKIILNDLNEICKGLELQIINCYEYKITDSGFLKSFKNKKIVLPYFTEMGFWNCKAFIFGPGQAKYAHSKNEKIRKIDIVKGRKEYLKLIRWSYNTKRL
ncbi:MAG: M20/M25/M40 family metallo-hydrolase [Candidatus ainarchaeum sp.]|nr:M20/M25/M40 family metallo-hydrolase [Candidatus ainarchaeum sp.]